MLHGEISGLYKGPFTSNDCDANAMMLWYRSKIKYMCLILYCYIQHLRVWVRLQHRWGITLWAIQEQRRCDSGVAVAVAVCRWTLKCYLHMLLQMVLTRTTSSTTATHVTGFRTPSLHPTSILLTISLRRHTATAALAIVIHTASCEARIIELVLVI